MVSPTRSNNPTIRQDGRSIQVRVATVFHRGFTGLELASFTKRPVACGQVAADTRPSTFRELNSILDVHPTADRGSGEHSSKVCLPKLKDGAFVRLRTVTRAVLLDMALRLETCR